MKCKDCRYFDTDDGKEGYCQEFVYPVNDKCFCNIDSAEAEAESKKPKPDVVEVVRCKDCKHYWKNWKNAEPENEDDLGICLASPKDDAFCSEGERREDVRKPD